MRIKLDELHQLVSNLNSVDTEGRWYILCITREILPYKVWAQDPWEEYHLQRLPFAGCGLQDWAVERLRNQLNPHFVRGDYVWKCDHALAPGGICVYDHEFDSAHDNCVYCGQPQERK